MIDVTTTQPEMNKFGEKLMDILETHAAMILEKIKESEDRVMAHCNTEVSILRGDLYQAQGDIRQLTTGVKL